MKEEKLKMKQQVSKNSPTSQLWLYIKMGSYVCFFNHFTRLFLFAFTFIITFSVFVNAGYAVKNANNQFGAVQITPKTTDEIENSKSKLIQYTSNYPGGTTYSLVNPQVGMKLGCSSTSIMDGLRDYDDVIHKWFKDDDASIKFEENLSSYNPDKILKPDLHYKYPPIKSIAKIQFLSDFYLASRSTVEECKNNGCRVQLIHLSPFSVGHWRSLWVDNSSFVEFNYKTRYFFGYYRQKNNKYKDDEYSYSVVIQGAKKPKQSINRMSYYIRAMATPRTECSKNCDQLPVYNGANKQVIYSWSPPYRVNAFYSDEIKKSCDY